MGNEISHPQSNIIIDSDKHVKSTNRKFRKTTHFGYWELTIKTMDAPKVA